MSTRISFNLSVSSVKKAQAALRKYQNDLSAKCRRFTQALATKGIIVAQQNTGEYGKYIMFSAETEKEKYGARTILIATNVSTIISQWQTRDGMREAEVSPLLMAEFGAGLRANISNNPTARELGMGTGSFPGQTHAEDPEGWWYMDMDGEWHHSYGTYPSMPMWNAANEIIDQIRDTAREVFVT